MRAAIDASGNVIAYDFLSKGFSRVDVDTNGSQPKDTLAGQTLGVALKSGDGFGVPGESYGFANKRTAWETIAPLLDRASPLRTAHMRDPVGPQIHFASESFIDEVAAALNVDPVEFRLRYVKDPRDIAVIKAAAEKAGWQSRPSPRNDQTGDKVSGRGIAYAQRGPTRVAVIAEVDVDRSTGKIWARKFTVAHDCGQIINPDGLHHAIENNIVQATSRTLWEEVKFDNKNVTSVDWRTYPILDIDRGAATGRHRVDQSSGDRAIGRRRGVEPAGAGCDRQRRVRRHRRAHPPRAVLAGQREVGAVVSFPSPRKRGEGVACRHDSNRSHARRSPRADRRRLHAGGAARSPRACRWRRRGR